MPICKMIQWFRHFPARADSVCARGIVLLFGLTQVTGIVSAQAVSDSAGLDLTGYGGPDVNFIVSALKVLVALGFTLALMILVLYLIRRFFPFAGRQGMTGGAITVLEIRYLAPKKAVALVRVAGRVLVIGISEQSVTTLAELTPEESAGITTEPSHTDGFSSILKRFTKGGSIPPS